LQRTCCNPIDDQVWHAFCLMGSDMSPNRATMRGAAYFWHEVTRIVAVSCGAES
jgi:hypothetical protein